MYVCTYITQSNLSNIMMQSMCNRKGILPTALPFSAYERTRNVAFARNQKPRDEADAIPLVP